MYVRSPPLIALVAALYGRLTTPVTVEAEREAERLRSLEEDGLVVGHGAERRRDEARDTHSVDVVELGLVDAAAVEGTDVVLVLAVIRRAVDHHARVTTPAEDVVREAEVDHLQDGNRREPRARVRRHELTGLDRERFVRLVGELEVEQSSARPANSGWKKSFS